MTYRNHIFTIHNRKSGNTFQVMGKANFIEWLNRWGDNSNFKYFTTYNNFLKWEKTTVLGAWKDGKQIRD